MVLVSIMERLDVKDVLRLRQTSRIFMRLFSQAQEFQSLRLAGQADEARRLYVARVWATPSLVFFIPNSRHVCSNQDNRGSKTKGANPTSFLHCSACQTQHQRIFYFSPLQRTAANDDERICLGHEQAVTICDHLSFTWESLNRLVDSSGGEHTVRCHHKQHTSAPTGRYKSSWHNSVHTGKPDIHDDGLCLEAWRDSSGELCFRISATVHVPRCSGALADLHRRRINDVTSKFSGRKLSSAGALFPLWGRNNDNMKPFDPNICSCLDREVRRVRAETKGEFKWDLVLNPAKPWRSTPEPGSDYYTGANGSRRRAGNRCGGFAHEINSESPDGRMSRHLSYRRCPVKRCGLFLKQVVEVHVRSPHSYEWLRCLDSSSVLSESDEELRAFMQCSDQDCALKKRHDAWKMSDKHPDMPPASNDGGPSGGI
jgi:hypothetical protein